VATHDLSRIRQEFDLIISLRAGAVVSQQAAELYQQAVVEESYE
jgi:ABC-type Mn2+/Zn2+ transport system ATPase subunit